MKREEEMLPAWDALLSAGARLQKIVPGAVLVGGTAAAVFARHRFSLVIGFVTHLAAGRLATIIQSED